MKTQITIVGGGNSTHSLIPLLTKENNEINLFTRKPEKWDKNINMEYTLPDGTIKEVLQGQLNKVSNNPQNVIPEADIIILCIPVFQYRNLLHQIAPYINKSKKVYVGTIYGQGGFNWMVKEIINKFNLDSIVYFASGLIPWIARTKEYGKIGINYGCKTNNVVAISDKQDFPVLKQLILNDLCLSFFGTGEYFLSDNFISLTLSVDNQIIHQTRLYGLYLSSNGQWKSYNEVPYFYRDYDDVSAKILEDLDKEYSLIREEIKKQYSQHDFKYMLDYLELEHFSYGSSSPNIKESFIGSETLGQIPTPVIEKNGVWGFDASHRFFFDDIYYGIAIAKWIAEKMNINTPTINKIMGWAQEILSDELLDKSGKLYQKSVNDSFLYGTPDVYGYLNINDIMG